MTTPGRYRRTARGEQMLAALARGDLDHPDVADISAAVRRRHPAASAEDVADALLRVLLSHPGVREAAS